MTPAQIERRLRMHLVNICLASLGGRENDLRECKVLLVGEVAKIISEERERCAHIALAIDSKRGNEKEIACAIRAQA